MAEITTLGREKVRAALPDKYKDFKGTLGKKELNDLYTRIAKNDPDEYVATLQRMNTLGVNVASLYGKSASLSVADFTVPPSIARRRDELKAKVDAVYESPMLNADQKSKAVIKMVQDFSETIDEDLLEEVGKQDGAFALQINSGSRGKAFQLRQMLLGNLISADSRGQPVGYPNLEGYAGGVSPLSYWAASHGGRKGYCLHEDTLVRMADMTTRLIKDVLPGEQVLGADTTGATFPVTVLEVLDNGVKDVQRYTFRVGRMRNTLVSLECTEDHEVLAVIKNGKKTPHLRTPSKLPMKRAWRCFGAVPAAGLRAQGGLRQQWARLLGFLIGAGHLSEANSITLSSADPETIEGLREEYPLLDIRYIKRRRTSGMPSIEYRIFPKKGTGPSCPNSKYRNQLKSWLHHLGLLGKLSYEKTIPTTVMKNWSGAEVAALVHGLFESDGCCTTNGDKSKLPCIKFSMSAKCVIVRLKELLATRFGVYATAVEESFPTRTTEGPYNTIVARRNMYAIRISTRTSVSRFIALLAYGRKSDKARKMLQVCPPTVRDDAMVFGYVGQEPLGACRTLDLCIDHPDHLFVLANGLIVSNSDVQFATADSGYFGKQLTNVSHRSVVTEDDCGTTEGIELEGDDQDNVGTVLAKPVAGLPAGTIIDDENAALIKDKGIVGRSALTCQAKEGICAKCAGVRETGALPSIGDTVGVTGARSFIEPLTQSAISSKHSAGEIGAVQKHESGFKSVNKFFQVPKEFPGAATLSQLDGRVAKIGKAPQGGTYVTIGSEEHYVPSGYDLKVKQGDQVEAGDLISDGMLNISELVKHKGLGEGRVYFLKHLRELLNRTGSGTNRRNLEYLARQFVDKVRITSPDGVDGHLPDDVINYSTLAATWQPRKGAALKSITTANKLYLEKPYLHYTIGTRMTPRIAKKMQKAGIRTILAHADPPPFEPEVLRAQDYMSSDPDLSTRLAGENLKRTMNAAATRGASSEKKSISYFPRLVNIEEVQP